MKTNKKDIDGVFAMILRAGDGTLLWKNLPSELLSEDDRPAPSAADARFILLIERYMAKHRFSIATAHGRFLLRKWMRPFQARYRASGPIIRLPIPEPPATM